MSVFEKAIEAPEGEEEGLKFEERQEIARFYMEFMQENCMNVAQLRNTE